MADGVTFQSSTLATPPAAFKAATDDCGSPGHVQLVKLAVSTDGSATALTADNTDGLLVKVTNPTAVASAPKTLQQQSSSGLTTSVTTYANGDTLGAGWTFTSMGSSGTIRGVSVVDQGDVLAAVQLYFFSGSVTFGTDNSAPSISDADALKYLFTVPVSFTDLGGVGVASLADVALGYVCDVSSLYVYAVTNNANAVFTATTDLRVALIYDTP